MRSHKRYAAVLEHSSGSSIYYINFSQAWDSESSHLLMEDVTGLNLSHVPKPEQK